MKRKAGKFARCVGHELKKKKGKYSKYEWKRIFANTVMACSKKYKKII
jgi:hypothetical protein